MASFTDQRGLGELFLTVAQGEREVEIVRQVLAEITEFEPFSLFKHLDSLKSSHLLPQDLLQFLKKNDVSVTDREARGLVQEMSATDAGTLSYRDFMNWLLPEDEELRTTALGRSGFLQLPFEVEYGFVRVLDKELTCARSIEAARQSLNCQLSGSLNDLFRAVDSTDFAYLTKDSLQDFFAALSMPVREEQLKLIIKRLDKDFDGKVSYSEFIEAVTPKEPFNKLTAEKGEPLSSDLKWRMQTDPYKPHLSMRTAAAPAVPMATLYQTTGISTQTVRVTGRQTLAVSNDRPWQTRLTQFRNQTLK